MTFGVAVGATSMAVEVKVKIDMNYAHIPIEL
jgi:hypothetical protein